MNATTSLSFISFIQLLIKGLISSYRIAVTAGVLFALAFSMMLSVSWFSSYWLITRQLCYTVNICNQRPQHISLWNAFTHRQKAYDFVITFMWQNKPQRYLNFQASPLTGVSLCVCMLGCTYQFCFFFFLYVLLFHIGHRNSLHLRANSQIPL